MNRKGKAKNRLKFGAEEEEEEEQRDPVPF